MPYRKVGEVKFSLQKCSKVSCSGLEIGITKILCGFCCSCYGVLGSGGGTGHVSCCCHLSMDTQVQTQSNTEATN